MPPGRAAGRPTQGNRLTFTEEPVPSPAEGGLLVRVEYLSIDPAMRTWMNAGRTGCAAASWFSRSHP